MATKIKGQIDMLAPDGDLDDLCRLRVLCRFLNKLDIPHANCDTVIRREPHEGKRYPFFAHTDLKF